MKGKDSILWRQVANGDIPAYYILQMEHQFMVSKARQGHLYVFDGNEGMLVEVSPQPERWPAIHEAWDGFMRCIETDIPPPLQERNKVVREDPAWQAAAAQYLALKAQADALSDQLDEAKAALLALSSHPSESGCGVTVTRFWKQGSVDYKRIPALQGLDLEPYRKKGGFETRVTAGK